MLNCPSIPGVLLWVCCSFEFKHNIILYVYVLIPISLLYIFFFFFFFSKYLSISCHVFRVRLDPSPRPDYLRVHFKTAHLFSSSKSSFSSFFLSSSYPFVNFLPPLRSLLLLSFLSIMSGFAYCCASLSTVCILLLLAIAAVLHTDSMSIPVEPVSLP